MTHRNRSSVWNRAQSVVILDIINLITLFLLTFSLARDEPSAAVGDVEGEVRRYLASYTSLESNSPGIGLSFGYFIV